MKYSLGFGKTSQTVLIDDAYRVSVLEPESPRVEKGEQEILERRSCPSHRHGISDEVCAYW